MSLAQSVSTPSNAARRSHARRKLDGLSYVEFGPDNGAILIDLGEGGLGFQSVLPVSASEILLFKFKFPGQTNYVEGFAEVAWMNESGKGGGLRFTELSDETRGKIREWTGVMSAPEAGALDARINAALDAAAENPIDPLAPDSKAVTSNTAPKTFDELEPEPPAKVSEEFATRESAQPPSPSIEKDLESAGPVREAATTKEVEEAPVEIKAPQRSVVPEFTIEVAPPLDPPAAHADSLPPAPTFVRTATSDAVKAKAPQPPASGATLPVANTHPAVEGSIPAPVQARRIPAPAKPNLKPDTTAQPLAASPAPESPVPEPSLVRQAPPAQRLSVWKNVLGQNDHPTLASQVLRIGAGVAAGAAFVLLVFLIVPSLRTRVEATASRSPAFNPAGLPAFELEVADINNRRWILRGGGEAGSPFSEPSSRREAQSSNSANAGRNEAAKSSRSEEADDSTTTTTAKQSKLPKAAELALARPRAGKATTASAQVLPPSIFDGITPPIGSVSDRLASGGPEAPGIVPPETRQPRTSALQSAVLAQRVSPVYPPNAIQSHVQGDVQVNATIGKDGVPKNLKVISGDLRLVPSALDAIRQWRYRPATLAGEPFETEIVVTVSFHLK